MLGYLLVAFVLTATSYAAYLDLKTTEVPDSLSILVALPALLFHLLVSVDLSSPLYTSYILGGTLLFIGSSALFLRHIGTGADIERARETIARIDSLLEGLGEKTLPGKGNLILASSFLILASALYYGGIVSGGYAPVMRSVVTGSALFALGWAMYLAGMWGGADAFVLGAVGFALPVLPAELSPLYTAPWPFPLSLVLTVFFVGSLYSILYAAVLSFRRTDVLQGFHDEMKGRYILLILFVVSLPPLVYVASFFVPETSLLNVSLLVTVLYGGLLLFFLHRFLQGVERDVMRREIPTGELSEGDVLAESIDIGGEKLSGKRYVGLARDEVEAIRMERESVEVKTGVPFIAAFPISILLLSTLGDPLYAIIVSLV